jgi:glycosyltransferase involved in cell wall biosynthesis
MPKILYNVNIPRFFVSHRLPLALAAAEAGYDVHITTSDEDKEHVAQIIATGLPFHPLPLAQHGTNPFGEVRTLNAMIALYRQLKPDLVHHVSIKPVLYGGIAARITGVKAVVGAMSGLGHVFIAEGAKAKLLRQIVKPLFGLALGHGNSSMIFQNPEDRQRFLEMRLVRPERAILIRGSGVDMDVFAPIPETEGKPIVLFAGRLMWKKGLGDFVEAARQLKEKARFVVVGYAEATSPDTVSQNQLEAWAQEGVIEYWGKRDDMPLVFAQSHLVCLPSTYGEGVPKVLIEAAACGRAIVTTDTAGCREIGHHEENALLVPPNNMAALVAALERLITHPQLRQQMGMRGREIAIKEFSLNLVVKETLSLYEELLSSSGE